MIEREKIVFLILEGLGMNEERVWLMTLALGRDPSERIDRSRNPGVRGNQERSPCFNRAKDSTYKMQIQLTRTPKPSVVGQVNKHLRRFISFAQFEHLATNHLRHHGFIANRDGKSDIV